MVRLPPVRDTPPSRTTGAGVLGALGSPGVRTVVLYAIAAGVAFGAVELAMPAFAEEHGARELGGVAIACFAAGSLVGGLIAWLPLLRSELRRFLMGALALVVALLGFSSPFPFQRYACSPPTASASHRPTVAALYSAIHRPARAGTAAEAFAWFGTAISIGIAGGSAVGSPPVDERGVRWAFGFASAFALVGVLLGRARRDSLAVTAERATDRSRPSAATVGISIDESRRASTPRSERP